MLYDPECNLYDTVNRNKTEAKYTIDKCSIEFTGTDDKQKVHGLTQSVAWFNEANEISKVVFDQIDQRTSHFIMIDWNPQVDCWIDKLALHPRAIVIHSTFKDNTYCPVESRRKIEGYEPTDENIANGTADQSNWDVYGLGIKSKKEGLIFPKWQEFKGEFPTEGKYFGYGLDWGFNPDPGACVRGCVYDGAIYFDEVYCELDLVNVINDKYPDENSVEKEFEKYGVEKLSTVGADSSEPRSIREMRIAGYSVVKVKKPAGSVESSIKALNTMPVFVTSRSLNILREMRGYCYKIDPATGEYTGEPQEHDNHTMDACRYYFMKIIRYASEVSGKKEAQEKD